MEYTKIIDDQSGDEPQVLALTGCRQNGSVSQILQIQIEQDGNDAYIDLNGLEAKALVEKINEWRASNGWLKEFNSIGLELIKKERIRQIEVEGWTIKHDLEHTNGELANAAATYAMTKQAIEVINLNLPEILQPALWPFEKKWYKPTPNDRIKELQKAGALIAAEIDRLTAINDIEVNEPSVPEPPANIKSKF